eukprot:ANDGO_05510.mRNA.1 hypothetical protein
MDAVSIDERFLHYRKAIESSISSLDKPLQIRCQKWMEKLKEPVRNVSWKKTRNDYAKLLLLQVKTKELTEPFDKLPKSEELPNLPLFLRVRISDKKSPTHFSMFEASGTASSGFEGVGSHGSTMSGSGSGSGSSRPGITFQDLLAESRETSSTSSSRNNGSASSTRPAAAAAAQANSQLANSDMSNKQLRSGQLAAVRLEQVSVELEDLKIAFSKERQRNEALENRIRQMEIALSSSQTECLHLQRMLDRVVASNASLEGSSSVPVLRNDSVPREEPESYPLVLDGTDHDALDDPLGRSAPLQSKRESTGSTLEVSPGGSSDSYSPLAKRADGEQDDEDPEEQFRKEYEKFQQRSAEFERTLGDASD